MGNLGGVCLLCCAVWITQSVAYSKLGTAAWLLFWAAGGVTKEMLAPFAMSLPEQHKKLLKCHNGSQMKNYSKHQYQIFPMLDLNELLWCVFADLFILHFRFRNRALLVNGFESSFNIHSLLNLAKR